MHGSKELYMPLSRLTVFALTAAALSLASCGGDTASAPQADSFLTKLKTDYPVSFAKIADNSETGTAVWVHTTNYKLPGQAPLNTNGLVVLGGDDVILIDGAWGELATVALLEAVKAEAGKAVTKMVVTDFYPSNASGVDAAEREGIQIYSHPDTAGLAARRGFAVPNTSVAALKAPKTRAKIENLEILFPGPAHTPDNLVIYIPDVDLLYGGGLIRGVGKTTLGNIDDADLTAWSEALRLIKSVYKDAKIVVPGQGNGGDISLLDHTYKLLAAKVNADADVKATDEAQTKP